MRFDVSDVQVAPPPSRLPYTPQQLAVFAAVEAVDGGNLEVTAVAGSGKTTTLVGACERMKGTVAFCAFNKKIADEIGLRTRHLPNVKAGTFHSFGFGAWRKVTRAVQVQDRKLWEICEDEGVPDEMHQFCVRLVSIAKQQAFNVEQKATREDWEASADYFELWDLLEGGNGAVAVDHAMQVLQESVHRSGQGIDFDDMLYMPLLARAPIQQYDWVLVDEAQDTNATRRMLAARMLKPGGRLVMVGDPHQAIYGFTGADNDALARLSTQFSCRQLPLTYTFRCPKAVVAHAQQWVSHILCEDSAPEGVVRTIREKDFEKEWTGLRGTDAVLCRNVKPLVALAYRLIREGVGVRVEGRDIGKGLAALIRKFKTQSLDVLSTKLEAHRREETRRLMARGKDMQAAALEDKVETIFVLMEVLSADGDLDRGKTTLPAVPDPRVSHLLDMIERLFIDSVPGEPSRLVILSTVHKSKGREWDRVYLLGRNLYMPSKYAKQDWQKEQERNLMYVAVTRARRELVEVEVEA